MRAPVAPVGRSCRDLRGAPRVEARIRLSYSLRDDLSSDGYADTGKPSMSSRFQECFTVVSRGIGETYATAVAGSVCTPGTWRRIFNESDPGWFKQPTVSNVGVDDVARVGG